MEHLIIPESKEVLKKKKKKDIGISQKHSTQTKSAPTSLIWDNVNNKIIKYRLKYFRGERSWHNNLPSSDSFLKSVQNIHI